MGYSLLKDTAALIFESIRRMREAVNTRVHVFLISSLIEENGAANFTL
jgi:hypothetical protein